VTRLTGRSGAPAGPRRGFPARAAWWPGQPPARDGKASHAFGDDLGSLCRDALLDLFPVGGDLDPGSAVIVRIEPPPDQTGESSRPTTLDSMVESRPSISVSSARLSGSRLTATIASTDAWAHGPGKPIPGRDGIPLPREPEDHVVAVHSCRPVSQPSTIISR